LSASSGSVVQGSPSLPSEAQWECGARGGKTTLYSCSPELEPLKDKANVRDKTMEKSSLEDRRSFDKDADFAVVHWAVGTGDPNPFGLHGVHGDVWDWCLDPYAGQDGYEGAKYVGSSDVDPVAVGTSDARCVVRGGSFRAARWQDASAARSYYPPAFSGSACGVRPARAVAE
jgi:formylglycine-generating enzyme required for sulfatase activity